jgi:type IV pilus assembly protein PilE
LDIMRASVRDRRGVRRSRGFTLIELMIAVAVVAILAAVALPSYLDSVRKGRRAEAFQAISAVQQAQERYRGNHPAYAASLSDLPGSLPSTTPSGYYGISLSGTSATDYIVTAAAVSGTSQANDGPCAQLRVRVVGGNVFYESAAAGATTFDDAAGRRCWAR